jgi:hypothetical protein
MASALDQSPPVGEHTDAGVALFELLGFADAVTASQPSRPFEPLAFPALAQLVKLPREKAAGTAHAVLAHRL